MRGMIFAAITLFLLGYWLYPFLWHGFFYQAMGAGLVILFYSLWRLTKYKIALIGLLFAINNILDEIFFEPTKFQWNEIIFALSIIIIVCRQKTKQPPLL